MRYKDRWPEQARKIFSYNVGRSDNKDDKYRLWSHVELVKLKIKEGNEVDVEAAINKMVRDFAGEPILANELIWPGDYASRSRGVSLIRRRQSLQRPRW